MPKLRKIINLIRIAQIIAAIALAVMMIRAMKLLYFALKGEGIL